MPLTCDAKVTIFRLAAGEPFVVQLSPVNSSGITIDPASREFVITVYGSDRQPIDSVSGVHSGGLFEFVRDGDWTAGLNGGGLKLEIAERLRNGKYVIATSSFTIDPSALSVTELSNGATARSAVLLTATLDATGLTTVNAAQVAYAGSASMPIYMMNFSRAANAAYASAI